MTKLGLAGSALLATAGGATTLASGLTITAHASEKPKTNTQQTNQADKLKKASNQLDTASKQQAKMINALLESKVDAQVPTQPGTYTKSVVLLDASGKQLGTATLTRVVNADGSTQSSLSKDIPAGYTLKDVNVLNHYPSAVTLTRVAGATQAGTTTKAIKLTDASGKLIATGTATRVVDEEGASTVSVKGIPQGYKVANMGNLSAFPDQIVIEKGEAINSNTAENTDAGTMNNVPAGGTTADSRKILDSGGVTKTAGQGNQQTGNTASGTTTGNTGSQSGQAQQGGTTTTDQGKADAGTTTNTGADTNKGQQTSDASKDSSKTSTDSKTTTDQGKTDTKKDDSKTSTSTTDSAKKDDSKKDDSKASTDEKKDEAKKDDSKSDTSKTDASKTADNSKANDTNSKVDNAIKGIDSVAKGSTDATKSADSKSSDTDKKDDSKKSDSSKSDNKKSDDKKSDKKDGKLDLSDTTDALKKSSKDDDKKDSNSDNSSKKDNVSNLLNKSANKSSKASDNAKVADADVSDNLSGKDDSTKKGTTSSSTNATLPETGNTQSTAGILAGSAMVATMTALGIGASRRKRV